MLLRLRQEPGHVTGGAPIDLGDGVGVNPLPVRAVVEQVGERLVGLVEYKIDFILVKKLESTLEQNDFSVVVKDAVVDENVGARRE